jgi:hypothetical protein
MITPTHQQQVAIDTVISNGSAYKALESHLKTYETDTYLYAWPRGGFYSIFGRLTPDFSRDYYHLAESLMETMEERGIAIKFKRKEVGSLIRYRGGSFEGCILTDYLISTTSKMNLDNAQINELERLLNKVGRSLNAPLPPVPQATDKDMEDALTEMALEIIRSKPQHFHQKYLDTLAARGTPAALTKKDFHDLAEKFFTSM